MEEPKSEEVLTQEEEKEIMVEASKILEEAKPYFDQVTKPSRDPQKFTCADAARRLIVDYKDHWLANLSQYANNMNMKFEHTEAEWRNLFADWGAELK